MTSSSAGTKVHSLFTLRAALFVVVAATLSIWPVFLNGGLPYTADDSFVYLDQGDRIREFGLSILQGFLDFNGAPEAAAVSESSSPTLQSAASEADSIRSLPYSGFLGLVTPFGLMAAVWFQTCILMVPVYAFLCGTLAARPTAVSLAMTFTLLGTSLPFVASLLMPDGLGAAIVLYAVLLVRGIDRFDFASQILLALVAIFAVTAHYGNIPVAAALVISAIFLRARQGGRFWRTALLGLATVCTVLAGNLAIGIVAFDETSITPRRFPLLLARSIGDGPARWYLEEHCPERKYAVCEYWGTDIPSDVGEALWGQRGIERAPRELQERIRKEEIEILWNAFLAYPVRQITRLSANAAEQFVKVSARYANLSDISVDADGRRYPVDRPSQSLAPYQELANHLHLITYIAGLVVLGGLAIASGEGRFQRHAILILAIALMTNAAVYGGLSAPDDRYQARIAWLAPLMALVFLIERRWTMPGRPGTSRRDAA